MIDAVQMHNKFFTDTPADKNPAEINGSALKNFQRKKLKSQQSRWQGRKQEKSLLSSTKGKKQQVSVTGVFNSLFFVFHI